MTCARYARLFASALVVSGAFLMVAPSEAQAQPAPAPTPGVPTAAGTDHSQVVGSFGVGYLGLGSVTVGGGGAIPIPIVGARYWLSDTMGIDAGLGFGLSGGSEKSKSGGTEVTVDKPSAVGFGIHAGVPLVMASGNHHTFQLVPELNFAYGSVSSKDNPAPGTPVLNTTNSGMHLDLGARIGTEIQFGFIGLPRLSLQATVGLAFGYNSATTKQKRDGDQPVDTQSTDSGYSLSTNVQSAPWAIFTNTISALYYF